MRPRADRVRDDQRGKRPPQLLRPRDSDGGGHRRLRGVAIGVDAGSASTGEHGPRQDRGEAGGAGLGELDEEERVGV